MCATLEFAQLGRDWDGEMAQFFWENELDLEPTIAMAIHSVGGRGWWLQDEATPLFWEDEPLNGGWFFFREGEVTKLIVESASSASKLTAERSSDGTWAIMLSVPEENGRPYKGAYYRRFVELLGETPWLDRTGVDDSDRQVGVDIGDHRLEAMGLSL